MKNYCRIFNKIRHALMATVCLICFQAHAKHNLFNDVEKSTTHPCDYKEQYVFKNIAVKVLQLKMKCPHLNLKDLNENETKLYKWIESGELVAKDFDSHLFVDQANDYIAKIKSAEADLIKFAPTYTGESPSLTKLYEKIFERAFLNSPPETHLKNWLFSHLMCAPTDEVEGLAYRFETLAETQLSSLLSDLELYVASKPPQNFSCKRTKKALREKSFSSDFLNMVFSVVEDHENGIQFKKTLKGYLAKNAASYPNIKTDLDMFLTEASDEEAP